MKLRWILPILILLLIVGWSAYFVWNVPHVKSVMLAESANGWKQSYFSCPPGKHYYFVLGFLPEQELGLEHRQGWVVLSSNGLSLVKLRFDIGQSMRASWLSPRGLQGNVLNWASNANPVRLDELLIPYGKYDVSLSFDDPPPQVSASLWLVFTQSRSDAHSRTGLDENMQRTSNATFMK
jgi:hypothetical protein